MSRTPHDQAGFTLVELMTAVALTVILTGAMLGLAQRAHQGLGGTQANLAAVEDWRTIVAELSRDLRAARSVASTADRVLCATGAGDVAWTLRDGELVRSADGEPTRRMGAVEELRVVDEGASRRIVLAVHRPKDTHPLVFSTLVTPRTEAVR
ncbi:MAG: prepilin-type N-terminal cleavage/methylation domain-containing protein [Planctomycetes bacterium]|nr:prepilin-type N-terminal cleavage/methylation domain-containing protein [Planctomycetota bacterium]